MNKLNSILKCLMIVLILFYYNLASGQESRIYLVKSTGQQNTFTLKPGKFLMKFKPEATPQEIKKVISGQNLSLKTENIEQLKIGIFEYSVIQKIELDFAYAMRGAYNPANANGFELSMSIWTALGYRKRNS